MKKISWIAAAGPVMALLLCVNVATAQWTTVWQAGAPGRAGPLTGSAADRMSISCRKPRYNPPPGDPNSPAVDQQADDDYYFAGELSGPDRHRRQ